MANFGKLKQTLANSSKWKGVGEQNCSQDVDVHVQCVHMKFGILTLLQCKAMEGLVRS